MKQIDGVLANGDGLNRGVLGQGLDSDRQTLGDIAREGLEVVGQAGCDFGPTEPRAGDDEGAAVVRGRQAEEDVVDPAEAEVAAIERGLDVDELAGRRERGAKGRPQARADQLGGRDVDEPLGAVGDQRGPAAGRAGLAGWHLGELGLFDEGGRLGAWPRRLGLDARAGVSAPLAGQRRGQHQAGAEHTRTSFDRRHGSGMRARGVEVKSSPSLEPGLEAAEHQIEAKIELVVAAAVDLAGELPQGLADDEGEQ